MHSSSQTGFPGTHFEQATVELEIARTTLDEAADFFRTRAVAPPGTGIERASDDPHLILRFGQLQSRLHAAEGLLARAKRLADAATSTPSNEAAVVVAAIEARAFATDLVAEIVGQAVSWGTPVPTKTYRARTDTGNQPTHYANHWNYHYAGNYYLKSAEPPDEQFPEQPS
jgi:alkylation response protein AidB-like acyl-CoA dehydrogenase